MRLRQFGYFEKPDDLKDWTLESFQLGLINLLVGKNATGKTRCLNCIAGLAGLISQRGRIGYGKFAVEFDHDEHSILYQLNIIKARVEEERFTVDGKDLLLRDKIGSGFVYTEQIKGNLEIGVSEEQLAAVAKSDRLQQPFLERLTNWAKDLRHYQFGGEMGHHQVVTIVPAVLPPPDPRDPNQAVGLFHDAQKRNPKFAEFVRADMAAIGYDIEEVRIAPLELPIMTPIPVPMPSQLLGLAVKEIDRAAPTSQFEMSQGMFRALSIIVHVNYAEHFAPASCVLLDDVGEGLDFQRSSLLIKLLIGKAQAKGFQLIMTTNDRFVMNAIPLAHWGVVIRQGSKCQILNVASNPDLFNEFEFTGLNNFDFLATEFWKRSLPGHPEPSNA